MAIKIYLLAKVGCDHEGCKGHKETAEYREEQHVFVPSFAYNAQKHFEGLGWRFPPAPERCLCPRHATSQTRG